jgi:hypothetical protein
MKSKQGMSSNRQAFMQNPAAFYRFYTHLRLSGTGIIYPPAHYKKQTENARILSAIHVYL